MNNKFSKAPLSPKDKERKAEEFIGFLDAPKEQPRKEMKPFLLQMPITLFNDLKEISVLTGTSINAICREMLRTNVRKKLQEIKDSD